MSPSARDGHGGEKTEERQKAVAAPGGKPPLRRLAAEGDHGNAVEIGKAQVSQPGHDFAGVIELQRIAKIHGSGAIEENMDVEVLLLDKELEDELAPAGKGVPIDIAKIIPLRERTVLGEFHAGTARTAPPFRLHPSPHQLPRREAERFQALEKIPVEKGVHGGFGHRGRGESVIGRERRQALRAKRVRFPKPPISLLFSVMLPLKRGSLRCSRA